MSKEGENGQIVIYDAVNASINVRSKVHKQFSDAGIQTIFVESVCTDEKVIQANVRNVKVTSPDYEGWDSEKAVADYLRRISAKIPHYEEMSRAKEPDLSWVKMINIGERMVVNKGISHAKNGTAMGNFGYLGKFLPPCIFRNIEDELNVQYRLSDRVLPHELACQAADFVFR